MYHDLRGVPQPPPKHTDENWHRAFSRDLAYSILNYTRVYTERVISVALVSNSIEICFPLRMFAPREDRATAKNFVLRHNMDRCSFSASPEHTVDLADVKAVNYLHKDTCKAIHDAFDDMDISNHKTDFDWLVALFGAFLHVYKVELSATLVVGAALQGYQPVDESRFCDPRMQMPTLEMEDWLRHVTGLQLESFMPTRGHRALCLFRTSIIARVTETHSTHVEYKSNLYAVNKFVPEAVLELFNVSHRQLQTSPAIPHVNPFTQMHFRKVQVDPVVRVSDE